MNPESISGHEARLQVLERSQSEIFKRLRILDKVDERTRNMEGDVSELKGGIKSCAADCQAIRNWVAEELEKEGQKRRLSRGEILTFLSVGTGVVAAVVAALSSLGVIG